MSQAIFPTLSGLTWDVVKRPLWNTVVHSAESGKETRYAFASAPIWRWMLTFELLRAAAATPELQTLVGFFNARQGRFDSFLFSDPTDNQVTGQAFGTGDGTTKTFQLVRDYGAGGFLARENVYDIDATAGAPVIKVNGVTKTLTTDYTISASGAVTFVTAPSLAAALTWDGHYYWRVRFENDAQDFNNFLFQLWEAKSVSFVTVK